jgi:hypothetical protein
MLHSFDIIIVGAGASGLICAQEAAKRGRRVLLLDHQPQAGRKILVSGGGRCNFTNIHVTADHYLSKNPSFCISALKRFSSTDCMELFKKLNIPYVQKKLGQLFCTVSAAHLVSALTQECKKVGVNFLLDCKILQLKKNQINNQFQLETTKGLLDTTSLVIATGGLSYRNLGASDFGYQIAKQFGHTIIATRPALVPLAFGEADTVLLRSLSGISFPASVRLGKISFCDDLLFTHSGLSGPIILQISSYWKKGDSLEINCLPNGDLLDDLLQAQQQKPKGTLRTVLTSRFPKRFVEAMCQQNKVSNLPMHQYNAVTLGSIAEYFQRWKLEPIKTLDYSIAEVTAGGVDTCELSSKTFESKKEKGLYFIGEVVDITGQLGGYNLQWAWSSGYCCGQYV